MRELERAFAFAAKIETVPGTDAAPTMALDALRLAAPVEPGVEFISMNAPDGEQSGGKGSLPSSARAGRVHTFRVQRRLRGAGAAYKASVLPAEHALLMSILGGHKLVSTPGSEAAEYYGVDQGEATLSVIAQTMKQEIRGLGAVPRSARISSDAGSFLLLEVELVSVGLPPTQKALEAATLDGVIAPTFKGSTYTLDGLAVKPISFALEFGLAVSDPLLDGSAGDAHAGYVLTDRAPTGTMQIHIPPLAEFDPYALMASSEQISFVGVWGQQDYNRIQIDIDRLELTAVRTPSRGGVKVYELEYKVNRAVSPSVSDPKISFIK